MFARILVPTDGSLCSEKAIAQSIEIARSMGSTIAFLHVMDTEGAWHEGVENLAQTVEGMRVQGNAIMQSAEVAAYHAGVTAVGELVEGKPLDEIVRRAPEFDLVVMGSHGKGLLKRLVPGSVTEAVLHRITRPLLVVQ
jgi:nucleotide-binding universal stress UspA family protein